MMYFKMLSPGPELWVFPFFLTCIFTLLVLLNKHTPFDYRKNICIYFFKYNGLPWWLRRLNVCLQYGRPEFDPWVGSSLEQEMAIHSSTIAWKIPWTEEPGRLQSMGSQRVRHDWAIFTVIQMNHYLTIPLWYFRRRQWHPTPVLLPRKSHGRRSLEGCSPWGRWGSDTTERLLFHFSLSCIGEGNGNPLQCSCLKNPRDGGAWWAAVYGVAQSQTRLKWFSSCDISFFFFFCALYFHI